MSPTRSFSKISKICKLSRQKGISLIVGMIMLMLITLATTVAFNLSTVNFKVVSNMQFRDEAIAAANKGLEQAINTVFSTGFTSLPTSPTIYTLDINNDGKPEYSISIGIPECIQSSQVAGGGGTEGSSQSLGNNFSANDPFYSTQWDIAATVTDSVSGTSIEIHQGVRVSLSETQKPLVCP